MRAALLGDLAVFGIRRAARLEIGNHDALVWHDDHEHIGRHDGGGERAKVQQRRAAGKHLGIEPRHADQHHEQRDHQHGLIGVHKDAAQGVIGKPAKGERGERNGNGLPDRQIHHGRVDQEHLGAEVIDQHQHGKAREPCGVAFPFEPCQMLGHHRGGDQIFLDVVKAAAVHLPFFAMGQGRQAGGFAQTKVKRHKIERRPDPGDGRDDMQPAHADFDPFPHHRQIIHRPLPVCLCDKRYTDPVSSVNPEK